MQDNRNRDILQHICDYCLEIDHTMNTFGKEFEIFASNTIYQNAVALCVLQIGELTTHFTEEFKKTYNKMPWNRNSSDGNLMMPGLFGTVALLTSVPGSGFSINPLNLSKMPNFLDISFRNETFMEKTGRKIAKSF